MKWIIGIIAGVAIGFGYWYFIGCNTGACAIPLPNSGLPLAASALDFSGTKLQNMTLFQSKAPGGWPYEALKRLRLCDLYHRIC